MIEKNSISVIIPAKNEAATLSSLLPKIIKMHPGVEVIVVNDGSSDNTSKVCRENNVIEIFHPYSKGNGASIKAGARLAQGSILVFMDGDGQHNPEDISRLVTLYHEGFDMVVGSRNSESQASLGRLAANKFYNRLASWMVGSKVKDLTSGFRVVNASKFKEFIFLLPNGFSYPTTSTMAFFRAGYSVKYEPIVAEKRAGKSHINLMRDGVKFLLIIFKIGTLYSPLKIFVPISSFFFFSGFLYYMYTYFTDGRFTNMGALLFSVSVLTFLMGLISEQINMLTYSDKGR